MPALKKLAIIELPKNESRCTIFRSIAQSCYPLQPPIYFLHRTLFDVSQNGNQAPWIENPEVGTYHIASNADAYLCATGRAFRRPGTVNPLHVRYVEGGLSFLQCLEDVYSLTVLAWTRPEDCTRDPITIKLNDRRLGEDAGDYDSDALSFVAGHEEEEIT